jgi:hypothetical protein
LAVEPLVADEPPIFRDRGVEDPLEVDADLENLPAGYYPRIMAGKGKDWIDVYVHGKWGKSLAGQPVFKAFNRELHVAKGSLNPLKSAANSIIVGMDFGLNPSAVIGQIDMFGRLVIFAALTSDGMGLIRFLQTILRPYLSQRFPGLPVVVVGDPAGVTRAQTDERSCFDILKKEGFKALPARTNAPVARMAAVDTYLMRQVDGKPGFIIDPRDGLPLIKALGGGYRYKLKKSGELEDSPEKNSHSHIADACQYLCLHADGGLRGTMLGGARREVKTVRHGGWT